MKTPRTLLSLLLALAGTQLLVAETRQWTLLPDGKSVEAEYVDVEGSRVILLAKGKERSIELERLSPEDQSYVKQCVERTKGHQENKNFSDRWPTSTTMEDKLRAHAVEENAETGTYIYETSHFRFISPARLNLQTVSEMGRVFEGTYTACRAVPLNFPCRRFEAEDKSADDERERLVARLFLTRADYVREVGEQFATSAGIFREPEILVPFESLGLVKKGKSYAMDASSKLDTGTLVHELTHQMSLIGANYDVPIWFAEGMAEYMRLAYHKRGRFQFKAAQKNIIPYFVGGPGTLSRQLGKEVTAPPLEQFLNQSVREFQSARGDATQFNYGFSALLTYYFIHLDGKGDTACLKRWMRKLQGTKRAAAALRISIPAGASAEALEAAQQQLLQRALNIRETYYYEPLLNGRSWDELEAEISNKVKKELGITIQFK